MSSSKLLTNEKWKKLNKFKSRLSPHIEPYTAKNTLKNFAVFDIESNNWKDYVIGGIYDGDKFYHFDTIKGLCDHLLLYDNYTIFSHFGGIFDHLFILQYFGENNNLADDLMLRGSSIFSFSTITPKIKFIDSSGMLPFSLDKATKSFDVPHKKQKIDHNIKKTITPELIEYLKYDCIGLHQTIEKMYSHSLLQNVNYRPIFAS